MMRYDEQKQLVSQHLQEKWSSHAFLPGVDCTELPSEVFTTNRTVPDPPSIEQLLTSIRQSCPDLVVTVNEVIAEGSRLVVLWTLQGTDTHGYQRRLPTGKQISITGIQIVRCEQDQVIEEWELVDRLDPLLQLGFVCLPKPPTVTVYRPLRENMR
jgi:predicted ester cyclase